MLCFELRLGLRLRPELGLGDVCIQNKHLSSHTLSTFWSNHLVSLMHDLVSLMHALVDSQTHKAHKLKTILSEASSIDNNPSDGQSPFLLTSIIILSDYTNKAHNFYGCDSVLRSNVTLLRLRDHCRKQKSHATFTISSLISFTIRLTHTQTKKKTY
jgi:hypothetical protein